MPVNIEAKIGDEIVTAYNCRQDGSCRFIKKQVTRKSDDKEERFVIMDKYYLAGTFVDPETGKVISGPGEASRWQDAYTKAEVRSIMINNVKTRFKRLIGKH